MSTKSIVNNNFRIFSAQKFIEGLFETQLSKNNLFVWIGKTTEWENEEDPDQPNDTVASRKLSYDDMIAMKKVSPSDASLVIPRYDWTGGTVYSQYSQNGAEVSGIFYDQFEPATETSPFFVINSENNVYKCLSNNEDSTSSVEPTGTSTSVLTTADGYEWKFMFSVSDVEVQRYLNDEWIPVKVITFNDGSFQYAVQQAAVEDELSPPGGHGSNAVYELGAMYVMVAVKFQYDEAGKITTENDFRKFGLLLDPLVYNSSDLYTSLIAIATTNITLTDVVGDYLVDHVVHGETSGTDAVVVDYNAGIIRLSELTGTFEEGEVLTNVNNGAIGTVDSIRNPDIKKNSGNFLYTEHGDAFLRASDKIEDFKIVLAF